MSTVQTTQQMRMYNGTNDSTRKAESDRSSLGKDDFLKLLVTQLQNQDPTQPLQDREFIAQMTQFSSLEQMVNLNAMFSKFVSAQTVGSLSTMIGKKVTWTEYVKYTEDGEEKYRAVPTEGIVDHVSMQYGVAAVVLKDENKTVIPIDRIETVADAPAAQPPAPPTPPVEGETEKPAEPTQPETPAESTEPANGGTSE